MRIGRKPGRTETGTRLVLAHKTVRVPVSLPRVLQVVSRTRSAVRARLPPVKKSAQTQLHSP
jgi:hypothetical protein